MTSHSDMTSADLLPSANAHLSRVLSASENATRAECESEMDTAIEMIRVGWEKFGAALGQVCNGRLYREDYSTFDEYLDEYVYPRWRVARSTAYEWLKAAGVVANIERHAAAYAVVIKPLARINHARELARLPADQQASALMEARETATANGRHEPTQYEIKRVVTARLGEPTPRTPQETAHEREQRALCDHVRRLWPRIDEDKRIALLSELVAIDSDNTHDNDDD